jgi:hypothetical protein
VAAPSSEYVAQAEHVEALIRRAVRQGTAPYRRYVGELESSFLARQGLLDADLTPSRDATLRWLEGMLRAIVTATAGGYSWAYRQGEELWSRAQDDGVVEAPLRDVIADLVAQRTGRPSRRTQQSRQLQRRRRPVGAGITTAMLADLLEWALGTELPDLIGLQEDLDREMLADLTASLEAERRRANTTLELQRQIVRLAAEKYGTKRGLRASVPATALESRVMVPRFQVTVREALGSAQLRPAFPYLRYATRRDDRVRDNHAALEGFVASSDWAGWRLVEPPNGWRCRCRTIPITWEEARRRRWSGTFPLGTERLERFFALGGVDRGFPKSAFQVAA